jgi:hypothetical protein
MREKNSMRYLAIAVVLSLFVTNAIGQIPPAVYSACTNPESKQPARSAAGAANSSLARARHLSRIESRGHQSSGQSITGCFSRSAQATASLHPRPSLSPERGMPS